MNIKFGKNQNVQEFKLPCACPKCGSENLKCNGHETGVKGNPQKLFCRDCGRFFYPQTSYYARNVANDLKENIGRCLEGGRLDAKHLKVAIPASIATIYNLLVAIIALVNESLEAKMFWDEKITGKALFIDETFITIRNKTWYLIVIINEAGRVLHFDIVRHRTAMIILAMLFVVSMRLVEPFTHLVTDGFTAYRKVARMIGWDIVHVQHIHKPPYGRVIITQIHHEEEKVVYKILATTNEVLSGTNTFTAQVSSKEDKKTKGKPGRPKGWLALFSISGH